MQKTELLKSQFEEILIEDCKQYRDLFRKYKNKNPEDIQTLYDLTSESLMLAQRWSDIASNASIYAKAYEISKCDFRDWAYQRYRNLQEMHTDCRVFYKDAKDDLKNFGKVG